MFFTQKELDETLNAACKLAGKHYVFFTTRTGLTTSVLPPTTGQAYYVIENGEYEKIPSDPEYRRKMLGFTIEK
jgi:hypothetical protein